MGWYVGRSVGRSFGWSVGLLVGQSVSQLARFFNLLGPPRGTEAAFGWPCFSVSLRFFFFFSKSHRGRFKKKRMYISYRRRIWLNQLRSNRKTTHSKCALKLCTTTARYNCYGFALPVYQYPTTLQLPIASICLKYTRWLDALTTSRDCAVCTTTVPYFEF